MSHRIVIAILAFFVGIEAAWAAGLDVRQFLTSHCTSCHGEDAQEGDLRFDQLTLHETTPATLDTWRRIVTALENGEMPPPEETQPAAATVRSAIDDIVASVARPAKAVGPATRRLNRKEYEHTVCDLLGIDQPLADLLPEDGDAQGFDKGAAGLSISSVLLEQYLEAANVAFDATIRRIRPLEPETRHIELMEVKENVDSVKKAKGGTLEAEGSFVKFTPGWPPARIDPAHPIEDGVYRCRVALWPYQAGDRTLSVSLYVGSLFGSTTRKLIGVYDVTGTSDKPRVIEFTTAMKAGDTVHILPQIWPEHVTWRDKHEKRPGIAVAWAETYGPLDQDFPSQAQRQLFGDVDSLHLVEDQPVWMRHRKGVKSCRVESDHPEEDIRRILTNVLPKAFRRPVDAETVEPYVELALQCHRSGQSFEDAVRTGVTAVLCSPQFLLLERSEQLDDYDIASKLSYFLWSTAPDQELLDLAAAGKLRDKQVLNGQVERMIADPRIERFVTDFTGRWLDLDDIEFTTPDSKLYPEFDFLLQQAMVEETRRFFQQVLKEDLSVINFVDADWTIVNERLARHYGIEQVRGNEQYRKVGLPADSLRGGVLTQASVLKVTANGTSTSPVTRGVWVLDNILGCPSPPPPPKVPAVEPDIRGATTIHEQLALHRQDAMCASCHRRIDPIGFALEKFDVIGGERQWYRSIGEGKKLPGKVSYRIGQDLQTAGTLPDGQEFAGFAEFRELMADRRPQIARAIATKLLVYGGGRPVTFADRRQIEEIVQSTESHDYGLKSMIQAIVTSDLFLSPTPNP
ncbi:DUF1592 domain-containing protein [Blastopirellula retiformator]|uniref:Planctomycete cytochrome C n=1 Tax=Blastopirellula retiformator TaxID=2527970 RepID=A0A5C5V7I6_9BACT|nr:DUF1592 domain-containing protein [Blastopirellula retiformator]TWT34544.1 Planctomycete cytochrome C [Blastopirellula retiformator]